MPPRSCTPMRTSNAYSIHVLVTQSHGDFTLISLSAFHHATELLGLTQADPPADWRALVGKLVLDLFRNTPPSSPALTRHTTCACRRANRRIAIFSFAPLPLVFLGSTKTERRTSTVAASHSIQPPTPPAATGFACLAGFLVAIGSVAFPTRNPNSITSGTWLANSPRIFCLSRTVPQPWP
ncbi:uncharacterized protein PG986_012125 [Apiospora aurea]|uniref:Uncharacterized protein n=1 Tax=Apiospora aurea TaxID=335848 RepID=A0ABR1PZR8_9PEZI